MAAPPSPAGDRSPDPGPSPDSGDAIGASADAPEPGPDDEALAESADEVSAYLVLLRGGAPFLSGADGRLLVRWLSSGVSVPTILAALDNVAQRRARRRTRSRLSLSACKSEVKKLHFDRPGTGGHRPWATDGDRAAGQAAKNGPGSRLAALVSELTADPPADAELLPAWDQLVADLLALAQRDLDPEGSAREAISATRRFHEAAWAAVASSHPALLAEAAEALTGLRGVLSEEAFAEAVEEVARTTVRSRFPLVSARAVWDTLTPP